MPVTKSQMTYATNPRAEFDYQILEKLESGMVLAGHEVKAIKSGRASIRGSYVKILGSDAWLVGATISQYQVKNVPQDYDPMRSRKLLLKKSELKYIFGKSQEAGLTLVPLKIFSKNNFIKLAFGIARGKKKYDKREAIKKREAEKRIKSKLKRPLRVFLKLKFQ